MTVMRLVLYYYVFLTVYACVAPVTLSWADLVPAMVLMWMCYGAFRGGCGQLRNRGMVVLDVSKHRPYWLSGKRRFLVAVLVCISTMFVVRFYTGHSVQGVIEGVASNENLYGAYQQYFTENELGTLNLSKTPFILMLFFVKFVLVASYISLVGGTATTRLSDKVFLGVMTVSYLLFGTARGTSFEAFEVLILFFYSMLLRNKRTGMKHIWSMQQLALFLVVFMCGGWVFLSHLEARGLSSDFITDEVSYNRSSILSKMLPDISLIAFQFSGYFLFGLFFSSVVIRQLWLGSVHNTIAGMFPFGFASNGVKPFAEEMSERLIDLGATWTPDAMTILYWVGFPGLVLTCFLFGRVARYCTRYADGASSIVAGMMGYIIVLQMIAMPIGSFVSVSSANILLAASVCGLSVISWWRTRCIRRSPTLNWSRKGVSGHGLN